MIAIVSRLRFVREKVEQRRVQRIFRTCILYSVRDTTSESDPNEHTSQQQDVSSTLNN